MRRLLIILLAMLLTVSLFGCTKQEKIYTVDKNGFNFAAVSSSSKIVNATRPQVHALAYNTFHWFKRLVLPAKMRNQQIDTIRLKLLKIAAKVVHSARYIILSFAVVAHIKMNSTKHWKTSADCDHSWSDEQW